MLPQHYGIEPGSLFGGEYPGDRNPEVARAKILALVELGVRTFIDLTSPHDHMVPYEELLAELGQETESTLRRISTPIPDMGIPDTKEVMASIMNVVRDSITSGPAVYIHCRVGSGALGPWLAAGCARQAWVRTRRWRASNIFTPPTCRSRRTPATRSPRKLANRRTTSGVGIGLVDRQTQISSMPRGSR